MADGVGNLKCDDTLCYETQAPVGIPLGKRAQPEARTKQVPVCTTRPVHYTKTVDVVRMVPKQVATTVTRCVPRDGLP